MCERRREPQPMPEKDGIPKPNKRNIPCRSKLERQRWRRLKWLHPVLVEQSSKSVRAAKKPRMRRYLVQPAIPVRDGLEYDGSGPIALRSILMQKRDELCPYALWQYNHATILCRTCCATTFGSENTTVLHSCDGKNRTDTCVNVHHGNGLLTSNIQWNALTWDVVQGYSTATKGNSAYSATS